MKSSRAVSRSITFTRPNPLMPSCLIRHDGISGFGLVNVMDRDTARDDFILVGDLDKLEDHVGELVEIKGKLADAKSGKVKVESRTKIDREHAPDAESRMKSET